MKIYAEDYGVSPGRTDTAGLERLIEGLSESNEQKELIFSPGEYIIDASQLTSRMMYITNTVGDKEFSSDETPHLNRTPLYFHNIKNLTVEGNGACFTADGKVTNAVIDNCENIEIKGIEFNSLTPDMHELEAVKVSAFYVDFKIDKNSLYEFDNGKLYFYGSDYRVRADKGAMTAWYIGLVRKGTPNKIERVRHPLFAAVKMKLTGEGCLRVYYHNTLRFKKGDCFYIYDVRRQYAGIFLNQCRNVSLNGVKQRFNYSLAFAAQDCDTITLEGVDFSPSSESEMKVASCADFIQICSCRGVVTVKSSNFCGAGDDCINTHGIHFKITEQNGNKIKVRFMHPQTHGFNPLRPSDTLAFINQRSLLEQGTAVIKDSVLINEYDIELTLDTDIIPKGCNIIEDISACPELIFENNTVNRIITRAVLYTSRGKCVIKNNRFISNTMSGILLSDDAKSWYESGLCTDVTIEDNSFDYCGQTPVSIKPENSVHSGAVHKNITIKNNTFKKYKGYCIDAKSTDNIVISGNSFSNSKKLKTQNCNNVVMQ